MIAPERPVLVAPDSFKGTFRAAQVAGAIGRGLERAGLMPPDLLPLADGGDGTLDALLAPAASAGDDPSQHPPTMPNSTKGAKKCGKASRFGATFKVFLTKGKQRISCKRARQIVRKKPLDPIKHYQYFDWTKGGNGPWSDVWWRKDHKVVVAGILYDY